MYDQESSSGFGTTQSAPLPEGPFPPSGQKQPSPPWFWLLAFSLPVLLVLLAVLFAFSSCRGGDDDPPSVQISPGLDGATVVLGQPVTIAYWATDDKGVARIELEINGFSIDTKLPEGEPKSFGTESFFQPPGVGLYVVTVTAYDTGDNASQPAQVKFAVQAGGAPPPGPGTATATPAPTDTPVPGVPGPDGCEHNARYVADLTIPDDTRLDPGTEFVKTWRLRNSGTCTWGPGYQLIFVEGDQMGAPASVSVPETPPEATVDVGVPFFAPNDYGTYTSRWRMRTADGRAFGSTIFVRIVVAPPPTETPIPTETSPPTETPLVTTTPVFTPTETPSATPTPVLTPTDTPEPSPTPLPDLMVDDLEVQVTSFEQPITLSVMVSNVGLGGTGMPVPITMLIGDGQETMVNLAPMAPGFRTPVTFLYTFAEPALADVTVYVDQGNQIVEMDETNNVTSTVAVVNPPIYVSGTLTLTLGSQVDFDEDGLIDTAWQVEGETVYLLLQNGAGAALLEQELEQVSYLQVEGLTWEYGRLNLAELTEGITMGLTASDGHLGYARVEAVLGASRTSARVVYALWQWPEQTP